MKRRTFLIGAAAAGAVATQVSRVFAQDAASLAGEWGGYIQAGPQRLRLRFEIGYDGDGLSVTAYSIDQGGGAFPGEAAALDGDVFTVDFPLVRGRYEGRLVDADTIEGSWSQGASIAMTLVRNPDFDAMLREGLSEPLTAESLEALRQSAGAPALAVAAVGPAGATSLVTGVRRAGGEVAATTEDLWHIGSITKSFTGTLVARLAEAGVVAWDDTVESRLGEDAPEMRDAYRSVTFRHLLSHRAGLPANIDVQALIAFPREEDDPRGSRLDYARQALQSDPVGPPEETFVYSNSGYVIAGAMLEAATGRTWESLMRAHVFDPLALGSAGFGAPGVVGALDQPLGHGLEAGSSPSADATRIAVALSEPATDNPAVLGPAGRIHIGFADLLRYLSAHRDHAPYLTPESWEMLHTPPFGGDYAMGWVARGNGARWHNGSNTLWYAEAVFDRERGVVACAAANDGVLSITSPAVGQALSQAVDTVT